jgi:predicted signal transduction protein with EAL and GGDEF domain
MQKQVSETPAASNRAGATETAAAVPSARDAPAQASPAVRRPPCSRPATAASIVPSSVAIDDFGTGYSSLAYLHRFPADVIKIDRSFVERLGGSESDAELLRTIVQLGQSLRMVAVAEGVETAEQALVLRQMGCELAQGFYFHRPLPPEALQQLLAPVDERREGPRRRAA